MATQSAYLNLALPDESDLVDISVIAGNFSALDSKAETVDEAIEALNTGKVSASNIVDSLTSTDATKPLSAKQGKVLNDAKLEKANVYNGLDKTTIGYALDARQGKLLNETIATKATTAVYTATLTVAGWSASAPYTQTVSVAGITAADIPLVDVVLSATQETAESELESYGFVSKIVTGAGNITATCFFDKPEVALNLNLKVVR